VARSASLEASRSQVYFKKHSCSPATGFLATVIRVMRSIIANLTPASGCQDHLWTPREMQAIFEEDRHVVGCCHLSGL
jgi:hypothetical protein